MSDAGPPRPESAQLRLRPDGTVESGRFGDLYQPALDGGQARAVFLEGSGLPERWQGRGGTRPFVIVELGVGTALNLRECWRAWLRVGGPTDVRYVGLDGFPLTPEELARVTSARAGSAAVEGPEASELDRRLVAAWPEPRAGWHRLGLGCDPSASARFDVELWHGEFAAGLGELLESAEGPGSADALFLDGFAPALNAGAWRSAVLERVGALARDGATAATWSVAGDVRRGLAAAGFDVTRRPGHGRKRHRLEAVRRPRSGG